MKKIFDQKLNLDFRKMLFAIYILFLGHFSTVIAQNCKPDLSQKDKIENKQIDAWVCKLYETPLMAAALTRTSSVSITCAIGRMDNSNFIQLQLQKEEESVTNAVLESSLRGAKGDEFYFGMKDGDPLKFIASEATNETKTNGISAKLVTTVTLTSEINSNDLQKIKDAFTGKSVDAVRVKLENGLVINQNIKDKNAKKMMDKANCFFNFLQDKGFMK
ncbi:MAG TPA: hypothetical protein VHD35_02810 [Chitinophagaceae bacterium]|jgi:hypothetical protein|nr:hypothetical protein [Chitinophagaceae bacterium]